MSDGITDERRRSERFAAAMRERLVAEDLLYGSYDPNTCPNLQMSEDPFCVPGGRLFGGCGLMWCQPCPTYFGPWGAWRAVLGQIVPVCDEWGFLLAGQPTRIAALGPASHDYFRAVGWSP